MFGGVSVIGVTLAGPGSGAPFPAMQFGNAFAETMQIGWVQIITDACRGEVTGFLRRYRHMLTNIHLREPLDGVGNKKQEGNSI